MTEITVQGAQIDKPGAAPTRGRPFAVCIREGGRAYLTDQRRLSRAWVDREIALPPLR
jgi:hypothetical protein